MNIAAQRIELNWEAQVLKNFIFNNDLKTLPSVSWWITSYKQYLYEYTQKKDKRGHAKLKKSLDVFQSNINYLFDNEVDCIEYLLSLYYQDGLSFDAIFKRVHPLIPSINEVTSLAKLCKSSLWWEPRDTSGSELTTKIRKNNGQVNATRQKYKQDVENRYSRISEYIKNKTYDIVNMNISNDWLEIHKTREDRVDYILQHGIGINSKDIQDMRKYGWSRIISNICNILLRSKLEKLSINFTIHPRDIDTIIKKATD